MEVWYERSFGNDYLIVYKHRDLLGAYDEVKRMIAWLQLPRGADVLDLCCGMGRHSLALSDFGYHVTGVDLSDVLLAEAKKLDVDSRVKWVKGDMRNVPLSDTYDAVVNLFTSFGYFAEDEENARVIQEIHRLLKPGARFIIDFLNPFYVAEHLVPYSKRQDGSLTIEEHRSIENNFVKKNIIIREAGSMERHYTEQVKLYGLPQLKDMIGQAGLEVDEVYGNYHGDPYNQKSSPRLIIVGHRKG